MKSNTYFFIIGAQRSGSTLLYNILDKSNEVSMAKPARPEPKYFITHKNTTETHYLDLLHANWKNQTIFGEKSTSYYEYPDVAESMQAFADNIKIIFIVRDPVERALSNYFFSKMHGLETRTLLETFVKNSPHPPIDENISVNPFDYLKRGEYFDLIRPFSNVFNQDNILVLQFEKLLSQSSELNRVSEFLKIKSLHFDSSKVINASDRRTNIDDAVYESLITYYSVKNQLIGNSFNIDLSLWKN
jgi:hypothetical protein